MMQKSNIRLMANIFIFPATFENVKLVFVIEYRVNISKNKYFSTFLLERKKTILVVSKFAELYKTFQIFNVHVVIVTCRDNITSSSHQDTINQYKYLFHTVNQPVIDLSCLQHF